MPTKFCFSGVIPNSDFLAGSGVEVDSRKAVIVDKVTTLGHDLHLSFNHTNEAQAWHS